MKIGPHPPVRCFVVQFPAYGTDEEAAISIIEDILNPKSVVGFHVKGDLTRLATDLNIVVAGGGEEANLTVYDTMGITSDVLGDRLVSDVGPGKS